MVLLWTVYIFTNWEKFPTEYILFKILPADLLNIFPPRKHIWISGRLCRRNLIGVFKHLGRIAVTTASENDWVLLTAGDLKQHFVIEAQSELRHSRQDHFELDGSNNFTAQDAAIGAHLGMEEALEILHDRLYL